MKQAKPVLLVAGLALVAMVAVLQMGKESKEGSERQAINSGSQGSEFSTGDSVAQRPPVQVPQPQVSGLRLDRFEKLLAECVTIAETDIAAAFRRIEVLMEESQRSQLRGSLAIKILKNDFSKAVAVFAWVRKDFEQARVFREVLPDALRKDRDATMRVIWESLAGTDRDRALFYVAHDALARADYREALAVQESMPRSYERETAARRISQEMPEADLALSVEWLERLTDQTERFHAVLGIRRIAAERKDTATLQKILLLTKFPAEKDIIERTLSGELQ